MAGLTTAYLLSTRSGLEVHVFEKAVTFGVDAASTKVSVLKDCKSVDVGIDVPMRSIDAGIPLINGLIQGYYPRLLRLLKEINVAVRPDDLTFAFSRERSRIPYLIYNGLSGIQGIRVPSTTSHFSAFGEIVYYSLVFIYLCIISLLHYHLHLFPRIKEITLQEFCSAYYIPQHFLREVLVPCYSGVCTCKESDVLKYPAGLIVGASRQFAHVL